MMSFSMKDRSISGCHWLWENLRFLQEGKIMHDSVEKEMGMMDLLSIDKINSLPSPRILNTHVFFDDMPTDIFKGKAKIIYIYRNPKDIAVSFFHHHSRTPGYGYTGEFRHYIKRFVKGNVSNNSVFEYFKQWEEGLQQNPHIPHLVLSYEELHKNPVSERRRVASFLGKSYDDQFLQAVAQATSIDTMKENKVKTLKDMSGLPLWYRKGVVGDWKNYFTVSESEWFDEVLKSHMADSKMYKFIYSLDS